MSDEPFDSVGSQDAGTTRPMPVVVEGSAMLTSLQLENYRGFGKGKYRISGLGRVNLLVGKNGCGKTSILEALRLLLSPNRRATLAEVAIHGRGETANLVGRDGAPVNWPYVAPSAVHFFHGHQIQAGDFFRVASGPGGELAELRVVAVPPETVPHTQALQGSLSESGIMPVLALRFEDSSCGAAAQAPAVFVANTGGVLPWPSQGEEVVGFGADITSPVSFLDAAFLQPWIRIMWERVVNLRRSQEVKNAMRIVEPRFRDIARDSGAINIVNGVPSGFLVDIEGAARPVPLGTLGGGFGHMLILAIALVQRDRGVILVDEIDTGLHYSIMGEMWRFIVGAALQLDVQVFATTHSLDCVRGLAWLCANCPELGAEVSLQKIVPGLQEAVAADAKNIVIAAKHDIEMR